MLPPTQARVLSGLKAFFKYLVLENLIPIDPSALLESPKTSRKLPDTLNILEINSMIDAINLSKPEGMRNKAMLEILYGCGLRVSELTGLKISNLYLDIDFIKILGKGNKERLVPIGSDAIKFLRLFMNLGLFLIIFRASLNSLKVTTKKRMRKLKPNIVRYKTIIKVLV
jgi:integrase/recombinase XerD